METKTNSKAVLSVYECHKEDFFSPREKHKQEDPRTTKSATQSAQITRAFLVLKSSREVHKQQQ